MLNVKQVYVNHGEVYILNNKEIKVGIIGFGTVGAGVAACLLNNRTVIEKRTGVNLRLAGIADLDITTNRGVSVPEGILTTDAHKVIDESDIVVELIGGTTVARLNDNIRLINNLMCVSRKNSFWN